MPDKQPIGVFDSGVGGLTVAKVLMEKLPREEIIYFGDTAHVPYGSKSREEIITYGVRICRFLVEQGAKIIVAACNTSSAVSLESIRETIPVPVIGVIEPGIRRAAAATRNRRIGVLATEAAVKSGAFPDGIRALNPEIKVYIQGCPRLVPLVEAGKLNSPETVLVCREYLEPFMRSGVDTIILGCTHYPFLLPVLQQITGPGVDYIDPAAETSEEVIRVLKANDLLCDDRLQKPAHRFIASGPVESFFTVGRHMVGGFISHVEQAPI